MCWHAIELKHMKMCMTRKVFAAMEQQCYAKDRRVQGVNVRNETASCKPMSKKACTTKWSGETSFSTLIRSSGLYGFGAYFDLRYYLRGARPHPVFGTVHAFLGTGLAAIKWLALILIGWIKSSHWIPTCLGALDSKRGHFAEIGARNSSRPQTKRGQTSRRHLHGLPLYRSDQILGFHNMRNML